jgi:hypothetical protein
MLFVIAARTLRAPAGFLKHIADALRLDTR